MRKAQSSPRRGEYTTEKLMYSVYLWCGCGRLAKSAGCIATEKLREAQVKQKNIQNKNNKTNRDREEQIVKRRNNRNGSLTLLVLEVQLLKHPMNKMC